MENTCGKPSEQFFSNVLLPSRAPIAQQVKRWTAELAVPGSRHAEGEIVSTENEVPFHTVFHYHPRIILKDKNIVDPKQT